MFDIQDFLANAHAEDGDIMVVNGSEMGRGFDTGLLRPYLHNNVPCVDVTVGQEAVKNAQGEIVRNESTGLPLTRAKKERRTVFECQAMGLPVAPVNNATTLTKDAWIRIDTAIAEAVRPRLRAWADLEAASSYGDFDGMSTPILERQIMSDGGYAMVDMDGIAEGRSFALDYSLQGIPLPITHSDFFIPRRFLEVSRRTGQPIDTARISAAGRRVGELLERTTIGTEDGITYGGSAATAGYLRQSKVYGYKNHPAAITKTDLTASATIAGAIATTGGTTLQTEVTEMLTLASAKNFYGPFVLYVSAAYDDLLDYDFKANSDLTIRQRLSQIDRISAIRRLDYLTGDQMLLVQMTNDVAQAINGMEIRTVQWETKGGMQLNFKVMCIKVPLIKSTFLTTVAGGPSKTEVTGIVVGTTA